MAVIVMGLLQYRIFPSDLLKLKYREIPFVRNFVHICPVVWVFWTEHGSNDCRPKFQNDYEAGIYVMEKRDFSRFPIAIINLQPEYVW